MGLLLRGKFDAFLDEESDDDRDPLVDLGGCQKPSLKRNRPRRRRRPIGGVLRRRMTKIGTIAVWTYGYLTVRVT